MNIIGSYRDITFSIIAQPYCIHNKGLYYDYDMLTFLMCMITVYIFIFTDIPSPVGLRNVSRICVTFFNISWNASNRIKCGDVSYNVLVFQSSIGQRMKQIPADNDTFYFSVTGLNNSDPNVTITVIASNRAGQGNMSIPVRLPESLGKCCVYIYVLGLKRIVYFDIRIFFNFQTNSPNNLLHIEVVK